MRGGEIFIPILRVATLTELSTALHPTWPLEIVGVRPGGEKFAEQLVSEEEVSRTKEQAGCLVIEPSHRLWGGEPIDGTPLHPAFQYRSDLAPFGRIDVEELRSCLEQTPDMAW